MTKPTSLYNLLQEHFNLCTTLIKQLDPSSPTIDILMKQAFQLREAIEREMLSYEISCKRDCMKELQDEIQQEIDMLKNKMKTIEQKKKS